MRNTKDGPAVSSPESAAEQKNIARGDAEISSSRPRYFERPDPGEKPLSLLETFMIVLSAHLGVRTRQQRQEDFRRANGLYLFVAGILYFSLLISGLIFLVRYLSR